MGDPSILLDWSTDFTPEKVMMLDRVVQAMYSGSNDEVSPRVPYPYAMSNTYLFIFFNMYNTILFSLLLLNTPKIEEVAKEQSLV